MEGALTRQRLIEALERLGIVLAHRAVLIEIAIYGGSALMLQFDWRQSADGVDAVERPTRSLSFVAIPFVFGNIPANPQA